MRKVISLIAIVVLLGACAQRPLSTREQGALTGAGLGAGTGAIIGGATGGSAGTGAAIGAGLGLLSGVLIGGAIENQRGETTGRSYAASPRSSSTIEPVYPQTTGAPPSTVTVDPTRGQFVNGTRWRVEVFVDTDSQAVQNGGGVALNPQETRQYNLDLGPHRVIAQAYVDTQFGTRTVGRFDRTIQVDPRGSGWNLRFTEADFS